MNPNQEVIGQRRESGTPFDLSGIDHALAASGSSSATPTDTMAPYVTFALGTALLVSARWYARRPAPKAAVSYNDDITWI